MRLRRALGALLTTVLLSAPAHALDSLETLLQRIADAQKVPTPLRADGTAAIDGLKGKKEERVVILERGGDAKSGGQVYVEVGSKVRLLVRGPEDLHLAEGGKAKKAAPDAALGDMTFSAEDFLPFSPARCAAMRIADLHENQVTIVCEPKRPPSQYSLMVYKFDRDKAVLLQALLYKGTMTNLVKMMRHDDLALVGSAWRPKRVVMQDFKVRTKDELTLDWKAAPSAPAEAFDAKSFAGLSLPQPAAASQ